ncbi:phosphate ABC transporter permease subunit PstC, partial [Salmonella enterica subsp. enterica serovar Enteritidis]|nr:phosphate ABC transporter permease subunit PstC [Salmonella enterica subsp. enterica serovar Enteritidis]
MSGYLTLLIVLAIGAAAFMIGRVRALSASVGGGKAHSRPNYHGAWAMLCAVIPALLVLFVYELGATTYLNSTIHSEVAVHAAEGGPTGPIAESLVRSLARGLNQLDPAQAANPPKTMAELAPLLSAKGVTLASDTQDYMIPIATGANALFNKVSWIGGIAAIVVAAVGAVFGLGQVSLRSRARNKVETVMLWSLFGASTLAIATTIGIVLSMLFQTITFFSQVSPVNFFFGTVWDPRFAAAGSGGSEGQFGLIPLLAGTLYIALIALLVAVPVGLMAAVYMSEYASKTFRSVVKPALELLAGIPTIVYGIFAMVTLGPWLRDMSAALMSGGFIQAQSIFTAGLVMGVML